MKVVTPLRVHPVPGGLARTDDAGIVQVALGDQNQVATKNRFEYVDFSRQLFEEVARRRVDERMDRVEA